MVEESITLKNNVAVSSPPSFWDEFDLDDILQVQTDPPTDLYVSRDSHQDWGFSDSLSQDSSSPLAPIEALHDSVGTSARDSLVNSVQISDFAAQDPVQPVQLEEQPLPLKSSFSPSRNFDFSSNPTVNPNPPPVPPPVTLAQIPAPVRNSITVQLPKCRKYLPILPSPSPPKVPRFNSDVRLPILSSSSIRKAKSESSFADLRRTGWIPTQTSDGSPHGPKIPFGLPRINSCHSVMPAPTPRPSLGGIDNWIQSSGPLVPPPPDAVLRNHLIFPTEMGEYLSVQPVAVIGPDMELLRNPVSSLSESIIFSNILTQSGGLVASNVAEWEASFAAHRVNKRFICPSSLMFLHQWEEFTYQTLILKHFMSSAKLPMELESVVHTWRTYPHMRLSVAPVWQRSRSVNRDPSRCKRTDGKKWQCSRAVLSGQKYCERHLHRGRAKVKKLPVDSIDEGVSAVSTEQPCLSQNHGCEDDCKDEAYSKMGGQEKEEVINVMAQSADVANGACFVKKELTDVAPSSWLSAQPFMAANSVGQQLQIAGLQGQQSLGLQEQLQAASPADLQRVQGHGSSMVSLNAPTILPAATAMMSVTPVTVDSNGTMSVSGAVGSSGLLLVGANGNLYFCNGASLETLQSLQQQNQHLNHNLQVQAQLQAQLQQLQQSQMQLQQSQMNNPLLQLQMQIQQFQQQQKQQQQQQRLFGAAPPVQQVSASLLPSIEIPQPAGFSRQWTSTPKALPLFGDSGGGGQSGSCKMEESNPSPHTPVDLTPKLCPLELRPKSISATRLEERFLRDNNASSMQPEYQTQGGGQPEPQEALKVLDGSQWHHSLLHMGTGQGRGPDQGASQGGQALWQNQESGVGLNPGLGQGQGQHYAVINGNDNPLGLRVGLGVGLGPSEDASVAAWAAGWDHPPVVGGPLGEALQSASAVSGRSRLNNYERLVDRLGMRVVDGQMSFGQVDPSEK